MSDFTSRTLAELAQRAFARRGLVVPEAAALRTPQARLPMYSKRALLETALAQLGVDAILAVGQEVLEVRQDPVLSVLRRAHSAQDLVERWQRLEVYFHSRHRVRVLAAGPRQLVLEHHAPRGPSPALVEDLLIAGLLAGLLMDAGARGVEAGLGGRGQRAFIRADRFTGIAAGDSAPGTLRSAARWRLRWYSFEAEAHEALAPSSRDDEQRGPNAAAGLPCVEDRLGTLLRSDPARQWRLDAAAAALDVAPRTLQRRLAQEGTRFGDVLRTVRARAAAELIEGGAPLAEAGFACGYADQAHFTREFGTCIGLPPGRFRAGLS